MYALQFVKYNITLQYIVRIVLQIFNVHSKLTITLGTINFNLLID